MELKKMEKMLKAALLLIGVFGFAACFGLIPMIGKDIIRRAPEFSGWYYPWLLFLYSAAIPCFAALFVMWKVFGEIGADRSFTMANARRMKRIALLAFGDAAWFAAGNIVLLLVNMNHPGVLLAAICCAIGGAIIGIAGAALSHLVQRAAELQEQSDLTI